MKLFLVRQSPGVLFTIGELFLEDSPERLCYTLEDPVREVQDRPVHEWKIPGSTAIPRGTYGVIITYSKRFERRLPLLVSVPGFEGIRIHPGNTANDTEGCILPGFERNDNGVLNSRSAFSAIYRLIEEALLAGDPVSVQVS